MPRSSRSRPRPSWPRCTATGCCATLHEEFPQYGFAAHKGYGTPEHLEALRVHGACGHHRRFFGPVAATMTLAPDGGVTVTVL